MRDDARQTALPASLWPRSSLLARLTASDREELLRLGTRATYPSQQVLIRHGDPEDHAVLLTQGFTKVVVDTENGYEALLAIRVGGDLVGEMATLERKPRAATVISCVRTVAHLIPADLFIAFLEGHPGVHREVSRMLSERLRFANEQRVAFAALPAAARVARILTEIAQAYGRNDSDHHWELGLSLNRADLASFAGVSLSSAEKALHGLRELGVLGQRGRDILILDLPALSRAAAGLGL
jgi:CRP/FNR family transcriptional regulator, cyclic AMP receptor protein